jgi:hypothetical protein
MRDDKAEIAGSFLFAGGEFFLTKDGRVVGKIEGTGPARSAQQIRRAVKSAGPSGTSFSKQLDETAETGASQSMSGASSIMGVLGVQEIDDALGQASRGKMRAIDILDRLEELRIELLSGAISRDKLMQLSQVVSARRSEVTDPQLGQVLDEIDLRAQVELAKYDDSKQ